MNTIHAVLFKLALFSLLILSLRVSANDFSTSYAIGSWQVSEQVTTNHKGKKTATTFKTSILSEESRNGVDHLWIEMEIQNYKIKKEMKKKVGDVTIAKVLVEKDVITADPLNSNYNLSRFYKDGIVQTGYDGDPMQYESSKPLSKTAIKTLDSEIKFKLKKLDNRSISVPAGKISCTEYQGNGSGTHMEKVKSLNVESKTRMCASPRVPAGMVYSHTESKINGKPSTTVTKLIKFGLSGAKSKITKQPVHL